MHTLLPPCHNLILQMRNKKSLDLLERIPIFVQTGNETLKYINAFNDLEAACLHREGIESIFYNKVGVYKGEAYNAQDELVEVDQILYNVLVYAYDVIVPPVDLSLVFCQVDEDHMRGLCFHEGVKCPEVTAQQLIEGLALIQAIYSSPNKRISIIATIDANNRERKFTRYERISETEPCPTRC